ncbi:hypothetical protein BSL78_17969 [Apostichopus japonicus]|uniref:EF-hand domain-containing protein n=1 Tax=Stichopus japonicus TaxID=307972 RepID=A0A2G8KB15_STIJA|nr:hypothetical protein BSL78_17969 [Apostichopus japonicus]
MFLSSVSVIRATSCKALDSDDGLRDWYTNHETNVCRVGNRMVLPQLNPVKIGKVRQLELEPGRVFEVKTVATKPPIFLIPNFLTNEECDKIIQLAQDKGLARSTVLPTATIDKASVDNADPFYNAETFSKLDLDGDNLLDFTEVLDALHEHEIEIAEKYTTAQVEYILSIHVDINSDRYLTELEFRRIPAVKSIHMAQWLSHQLTETEVEARVKRGPHRRSEQTWLRVPQYDIDRSITNR